jgi:hypothetical protein
MKDLIVLVPDKNMKSGLESLLPRTEALNILTIAFDVFVHPQKDPGSYHRAADFLRPFSRMYSYAIALIDREGSGQENLSSDEMADGIKSQIENNGWAEKAEVIVFDPELESWIWTGSIHTAKALGWSNYLELNNWLEEQGIWPESMNKPVRPKEAVEISLRQKGIPRSSSIYKEIAQKVSFTECRDRAFIQFKAVVQKWFPQDDSYQSIEQWF